MRVPEAATWNRSRTVVPSGARTVAVADPAWECPSAETVVVAVTRWIAARPFASLRNRSKTKVVRSPVCDHAPMSTERRT